MRLEQRVWDAAEGWHGEAALPEAQLVLVFGGRDGLAPASLDRLAHDYPGAILAGCSTAGEIAGTHVHDDHAVATAVRFAGTPVRAVHIDLQQGEASEAAGARLAAQLPAAGLVHVLVFSDGQHVNGSALVAGMQQRLPAGVQLTGGLAGDGPRFQHTLTVAAGEAREDRIVAVGFYGPRLRVGFGSLGGWDPFGPQRRVTRAVGNVLYELDGQPALALYKRYLGDQSAGLPATGLLFPLSLRRDDGGEVVRTILAVNEADQSMTFAGDIPEGLMVRLMKANFDRLVDGAHGAAETSQAALGSDHAELALLISCVGRKLVLKQRVEEELEAVQQVVGHGAALAGFYSYGEICPAAPAASCELHNQTMTITTFAEA
ncbi:MAG: hypothetical protein QOD77_1397 [Thermoplasmata archaeon]|jgi:hypothetical protein|nr:hypothetical protein [Thermoplasmata archaeon]